MDPWDVFGEERTEQVDSLACLNHEWRLFGRIAAADMKKRQLSGNSVEQEQQLMDDFGTVLDLLDCAAERVKCFAAAERCCSIALDRLQAQGWPHACWREAYVVCQVILAVLTDHDTSGHVPSTTGSPIELPSNRILNALNRLDLCFILGGPPHLLTELVDHFEQEYIPGSVNCEESSAINRDAGDCECTFTSDRLAVAPITSVQNLSPERFFSHFFRTNTPVLIRSAALHWPAIKCWTMEYLCNRYGHRLVPVEIGQISTKAGDTRREWKEKVFSLGDFVAQYMVGDGGETAYMAQHPLFEQIPLLKNDIEPPSILGTKEVTRTNCWIGTSGTITPFHFDSYENIFCQVLHDILNQELQP